MQANAFNDWLVLFYAHQGDWLSYAFPATTDPGLYYRHVPANVRGTAILKPGQYEGAYTVGRHRGYKALQQVGDLTVFRDDNRDSILDYEGMEWETGLFGINIHRASMYRTETDVGKWSAGCQVIQDNYHWRFFIELCERAHQERLTYTLLTDNFKK